ncbi:MAG: orotate phosphoribosyltransferase [Candidatus Tectomicrobia bacterium]|nr:orotate phosphoribosyltransferase [Candidatus Tectomicrobia bacterium]
MPEDRWQLLRLLAETSFHRSVEPRYKLASGMLSKYYIDCKIALSYPIVRQLVGDLVDERIAALRLDAVGGMALGAYPLALAVSDAAYRRRGATLRAFVVRKDAKGHGMKKLLEGDARQGDTALIVEDVVTTGGSTIEAIARCRESGLQVATVIALVDRQEAAGRENLEAQGVPFQALFTLQDLIEQSERLAEPQAGRPQSAAG